MAELKGLYFFLQMIGLTSYVWAFVISFGDIKSWILFVVGLAFAGYKVYNIHLDSLKKKLSLMTLYENEGEREKNQTILK